MSRPCPSVAEIRAANAAAGFLFFSRGAMQHGATVLHGKPVCGPGGVYFVTSENWDPEGRRRTFRVRRFHADTARITTYGEPGAQHYNYSDDARTVARAAAMTKPPPPGIDEPLFGACARRRRRRR